MNYMNSMWCLSPINLFSWRNVLMKGIRIDRNEEFWYLDTVVLLPLIERPNQPDVELLGDLCNGVSRRVQCEASKGLKNSLWRHLCSMLTTLNSDSLSKSKTPCRAQTESSGSRLNHSPWESLATDARRKYEEFLQEGPCSEGTTGNPHFPHGDGSETDGVLQTFGENEFQLIIPLPGVFARDREIGALLISTFLLVDRG